MFLATFKIPFPWKNKGLCLSGSSLTMPLPPLFPRFTTTLTNPYYIIHIELRTTQSFGTTFLFDAIRYGPVQFNIPVDMGYLSTGSNLSYKFGNSRRMQNHLISSLLMSGLLTFAQKQAALVTLAENENSATLISKKPFRISRLQTAVMLKKPLLILNMQN